MVATIIVPLLLLAPAAAGALERSVGVSTWMAEASGARLSPMLAFDGANFSVVGTGAATRADAFRSARLAGSLLLAPQTRRPLELRVASVHRDVPGDPMLGGAISPPPLPGHGWRSPPNRATESRASASAEAGR